MRKTSSPARREDPYSARTGGGTGATHHHSNAHRQGSLERHTGHYSPHTTTSSQRTSSQSSPHPHLIASPTNHTRRRVSTTPQEDHLTSTSTTTSSLSLPAASEHLDEEAFAERGSNFNVVIRIRPPLRRELNGPRPFQNVVLVNPAGTVLTLSEHLAGLESDATTNAALAGSHPAHVFTFDRVYGQECNQRDVYETTAQAVVESALQGYNATLFAYGQTGTGKTYTMEGFNSGGSLEARGIIPRAIEQIFNHIDANISARMRFLVRASYLQIYNESISDLLKPERNNLNIREDKKRGVFVEGLSEWVVRTPAEIYGLMERGGAMRATGSTKMNEISSRSHAVFIIIAEQSRMTYVNDAGMEISSEAFAAFVKAHQAADPRASHMAKLDSYVRQSFKVGKLNLVDLAGSERVRLSGATGQRLEESKNINKSLSALGNVISALTDKKDRRHIPYRESKLTRVLEDSLGGNCKTTMMAMISPALESMAESLSTIKFANRAKNIQNKACVNEDLDQKSLLRKYERELKRLRSELEKRNKNVVDKRKLLELDAQRRQAEEDKMAAIRALEERSLEFMREKQEKRRLEQQIASLTSQMLMSHQKSHLGSSTHGHSHQTFPEGASTGSGGTFSLESPAIDGQDPQYRLALAEEQERIKRDYDHRLADLEKERETIEEEKAQVDRYKQLLLKQRDIMIALTQRLNERDEQIMALQDELDAYDRHQKELEEKLDEKTAHLIHLQRVTMERQSSSPHQPLEERDRPSNSSTSTSASASLNALSAPLIDTPFYKPYVAALRVIPQLTSAVELTPDSPSSHHPLPLDAASGASSPSLLSAREKIDELSHLLHTATVYAEQDRSASQAQQSLTNQKTHALTAQLTAQTARRSAAELTTASLVKERAAVTTIMELKIKALVTAVIQASHSTIDRAGGVEYIGDSGRWLLREISALERLVNASIAALRNAAKVTQERPYPSVSHQGTVPLLSSPQARQQRQEEEEDESPARMMPSSPVALMPSPTLSVEKLLSHRRLQLRQHHV